MKRLRLRLHVHVAVPDLDESIRFYSTLFDAAPVTAKAKADYAKWMLEDPRVNFAISQRGGRAPGIDHVGVQADSRPELDELADRLKEAGEQTFDEEAVNCRYAQGDKSWVNDPAGVRCTFGDATVYGEDAKSAEPTPGNACRGAAPRQSSEPRGAKAKQQSDCCA